MIEQVQNLAKTSIVQSAWRLEQRPMLHGWVYDLRTGYLKELTTVQPNAKIDDIYRFELDGEHFHEAPEPAPSDSVSEIAVGSRAGRAGSH